MAKSGQRREQRPHFLHFSMSLLSGGKYPRAFIFFEVFRTFAGQNSTQIPQPLQYFSSTYNFRIAFSQFIGIPQSENSLTFSTLIYALCVLS